MMLPVSTAPALRDIMLERFQRKASLVPHVRIFERLVRNVYQMVTIQ